MCVQMPGRRSYRSEPLPLASPWRAPDSAPPGAMATWKLRRLEGSSWCPSVRTAGTKEVLPGLHPDLPHLDRGQVLPANQKLSPIKAVFHPIYVPYRRLNLNVNTFLSPEGDRAGTRRRLRTLRSSRAPPVSSCGWSAAPPVRLHLALSGERLGLLYLSGRHWHLVTEARDAAQHPAGHRRAPLNKELSNPNVSGAGVGETHEPRGDGQFGGGAPSYS